MEEKRTKFLGQFAVIVRKETETLQHVCRGRTWRKYSNKIFFTIQGGEF